MANLLKNIVTFGAAGKIEKKINEYEEYLKIYTEKYNVMDAKRIETNELLEDLISLKIKSIKSLKKIKKISKSLESKDRDTLIRKVGNNFENVNFTQISNTLTAGQIAINASKGIATGVSTAVGAWALVSTFGTASTGTAIGTLSGVAATNATLAWFGLGSLTTGGFGMAGGSIALGGIVAIPTLAIVGVLSHLKANKQIVEIDEQICKMIDQFEIIESNLIHLNITYNRAEEIFNALEKTKMVFDIEFKKIYREIYKIPLASRFWKSIRKNILKKNYFTDDEILKIAYIGGLAQEFATVIDTKLFDEKGEVTRYT